MAAIKARDKADEIFKAEMLRKMAVVERDLEQERRPPFTFLIWQVPRRLPCTRAQTGHLPGEGLSLDGSRSCPEG